MNKVAVIQKNANKDLLGKDLQAEYDLFGLCSDPSKKKVLKRDVDIDIDIDAYDWVILVGSEALQNFTKQKSVTEFCGKVVEGKFLPVLNPAMISFKPEAKRPYQEAMESINKLITGEISAVQEDFRKYARPLRGAKSIKKYLKAALNYNKLNIFGVDSETSALYPRDGHMLGISLAYCLEHAAYIDLDEFDEECEQLLQQLFDRKIPVFHNAKFDIKFFEYHLGIIMPELVHDTMLMHYDLDERQGTHGLKALAIKYTKFGNYEQELSEYIVRYTREHGMLKSDFSYDLIPFDVMYTYAAVDALATLTLAIKFLPIIESQSSLRDVYYNILLPGMRFLGKIEENGVPFDIDRLHESAAYLDEHIKVVEAELHEWKEIRQFERSQGKEFNPNSTAQLRALLFDFLGLSPTGIMTGTGQHSTNAEVLEILAAEHPVPSAILKLRKLSKIRNTYISKIIPNLDADGRLRTGFNLHMTTSGRLSSSGKLNMQQLPRDNPLVKGCIKARPGYKIVAMDLQTAEVYIAAVLSNDKQLQKVFIDGQDFHGSIAKLVFNLPCEADDVKEFFPLERQMAKAITFGIMYGAGAPKIAAEITKSTGNFCSKTEAQGHIDLYFKRFSNLKKWLKAREEEILAKGHIYSAFGRKRRLLNVTSSDRNVRGHEARSGINFLVQSVASDVNLLGAIETQNEIENTGLDALIFGLVHDSILAEVREDHIEQYCSILAACVQKNRGVSIANCPIVLDFDVHDDYSLGKYEDYLKKAA